MGHNPPRARTLRRLSVGELFADIGAGMYFSPYWTEVLPPKICRFQVLSTEAFRTPSLVLSRTVVSDACSAKPLGDSCSGYGGPPDCIRANVIDATKRR